MANQGLVHVTLSVVYVVEVIRIRAHVLLKVNNV